MNTIVVFTDGSWMYESEFKYLHFTIQNEPHYRFTLPDDIRTDDDIDCFVSLKLGV